MIPQPAKGRFGTFLRRYRQKKEISLTFIERETKIPKSTVSRIERGTMPQMDTLFALCLWLNHDGKLLSFEAAARWLLEDAVIEAKRKKR